VIAQQARIYRGATPDDLGHALDNSAAKIRAHQNVWLETGWFGVIWVEAE
jgi:predicted nucleotide-binding protein